MIKKIFLETNRIFLTEITIEDVSLLLDLDSDPEVMRYLTDGKPSAIEGVTLGIESMLKVSERFQKKLGFWKAYTKEGNEFIGWFHFRPGKSTPDDTKNIELGYRLKKNFWGQGYATEVSHQLILMGFTEYQLDSIFASTMKANTASQRVMEKLGMKFITDYIEENFPGADKTAVQYRITRDNWRQ